MRRFHRYVHSMDVGLDRLHEERELRKLVDGKRVALLAHPASVDRRFRHASVILKEQGARIERYFGPEHGFGGEAQDMIGVAHARARDGVPITSLYGDREEQLEPRSEDLQDVEVLVIDLQDVGSRYYTFIWTAVLALRVAARAGIRTVVLDRPNPIGRDPSHVEGRLQKEPLYHSFVGLEPIPVRHGLSLGEVVAWRAGALGIDSEALRVLRVRDGVNTARDWDRPFIAPSPNMPLVDTALVYPGACLLEGTNLSEGRGTTRPFETFGAPWLDGEALVQAFRELAFPGVELRPITFLPMFHKHARTNCGGVFVHVTDDRAFRPMATYVALIALAHKLSPKDFQFRTERYEFRDDVPAIDLLVGGPDMREAILAGEDPRRIAGLVSEPTQAEREMLLMAKEKGALYLVR